MRAFTSLVRSFLIGIIAFHLAVTPVLAQPYVWDGVCVGGTDDRLKDVATIQGLECLIANVFSVIITIIGLAGFVMLIIGSFRWMLSGSNSKGIESARQTMTYAVIGLVVALSAFILVNLLAEFTGINNLRYFRIPTS